MWWQGDEYMGTGDMGIQGWWHRDGRHGDRGWGTQGHSGVGVAGHGEQQCGNRGHGHMVAWG